MTRRRIPKPSDFSDLIQFNRSPGTRVERRVGRAANVLDLRAIAKRRVPRAVFDYVDGAADDEISLTRSRALYRDLEFVPSILRDVTQCDASTDFLGVESSMPFAFAPTGFTRMMHHEGESAVVRVADAVNIPYTLSTLGTTSPEDVSATAGGADLWFQLYVLRDRRVSELLIERARACGFRVLVLTVDVPVAGARLRDVRNGMTIPPSLNARTIIEGATHPAWWYDFLTTEPLTFASLSSLDGTVADAIDQLFDPAFNFDDLGRLISQWDGPVVVKGIQSIDDARKVLDLGAKAIILSNHGGRQLDRSPTTLRLVRDVREAVGSDAVVYVDGGILNGADVVAALALGANGCFIGRAYLYGLMAGGEVGVRRAVDILAADVIRTMKLLGVSRIGSLHPDHVRLPRDRF